MRTSYKIKEIEIEIWASTALQDAKADAICLAVKNDCIVRFEFNGVYYSFNAPSILSTVNTEETNER